MKLTPYQGSKASLVNYATSGKLRVLRALRGSLKLLPDKNQHIWKDYALSCDQANF
jgi:hypothetical protein